MASSSRGKEKLVLPNVGEAANQPLDFNYPKHEFRKAKVVRKLFRLNGSPSGPGYTKILRKV